MHFMKKLCGLCLKPGPVKGSRLQLVQGLRTWIFALCADRTKKTSTTNKEMQHEPKSLARMIVSIRLSFYSSSISAVGLRHTLASQGCASNGRPAGR